VRKRIIKSSATQTHHVEGKHRFEHWYVDNQVYFITARCRDRTMAFESDQAQAIFWDRFEYYTRTYEFVPWVTSLVGNHYHVLGYCRYGENLGRMIQRIHGSVAKLVNDILPRRLAMFWREEGHRDYFDGCIRDELQCRRAYRYTLTQCRRHAICEDWGQFAGTRKQIELDAGVTRALELGAFMASIPYKRYQESRGRSVRR